MIEDIQHIDMTSIFERYPAPEVVEKALDPRFVRRRPILNCIPCWSRGAEIGVSTG